jgi:CSLREA domain-containing protein
MSAKSKTFQIFGAFVLAFFLNAGAFAATFIVNNTGDISDVSPGDGVCEFATGNGACTLRAAVQESNALAGSDTIQFSSIFDTGLTISLGSNNGQIVISSNINIVGPGASRLAVQSTAPQSPTSRVFEISGNSVSISGMSISGGNVDGNGGAISYADIGTLNISDCVISFNSATGFGGGIRSVGNVNITKSTIYANSAFGSTGGGGIDHASGTLNITGSTIAGNSKHNGTRNGGGIWTLGATSITNSTITDNFAAPGGVGAGGVQKANNGYQVLVTNSIIAANQNVPTVRDVNGGSFTSGGYNIIGNHDGSFVSQPTDQYGFNTVVVNPRLAPLSNNGGSTPTCALLVNSPAIDKGNSSGSTTDQRGLARTFDNPSIPNTGDGTDVGAFERQASEAVFTAPFDFEGDGKTDLSIFRPSSGDWWYLRSADGQNRAFRFGTSTDKIVPADYTGDGKTDIAFWRPANGTWFILRSEDNSFYSIPFGISEDIPVSADFDRDLKNDLTVFRPSTATWYYERSTNGIYVNVQFGQTGDVPVAADYDNDEKTDIATFRPSTGEWWIQRSSTSSTVVFQFGNSSDKPVQGDYTGDGKADVAFYRPSTGQWFVLRSEDNSFFSFPFGAAGDIPVPGDYDGDGKFDGAVFRPSNATWYIRKSTSGTLIQNFGQNGDRPVPNAFVP